MRPSRKHWNYGPVTREYGCHVFTDSVNCHWAFLGIETRDSIGQVA